MLKNNQKALIEQERLLLYSESFHVVIYNVTEYLQQKKVLADYGSLNFKIKTICGIH